MSQKPNEKQEWPKPWVPWQSTGSSARIIPEPARLAPLGGAVAAVVTLAYYFFRQWLGTPMAPNIVVIRVLLTFVIGYAATGIFVWYVLQVAWRELAPKAEEEDTEAEASEEEQE